MAVVVGALLLGATSVAAGPFVQPWAAIAQPHAAAGAVAPPPIFGESGRPSMGGSAGRSRASRANFAAPAPTSGGGQISGAVTSAATAAPIAGIEVCGYGEGEVLFVRCQTTDAEGRYTLSQLEPGEYTVEFSSPFGSALNFVTQYYNGKALESEAQTVPVPAGGVVSGINAALKIGGSIAGTVTSAASMATISGIRACAYDEGLKYERCALTGASGGYEIAGLAVGTYQVRFEAPFDSLLNYTTQYFKAAAAASDAAAVTVIAGAATPGVDAALEAGGEITGVVTSFAGHTPLEAVEVCAWPTSAPFSLRCATTSAGGKYDITSLSEGEYTVEFFSTNGEYLTQYFDESSLRSGARKVVVKPTEVIGSIDAALKLEVPRALTSPAISGSPVEGQALKVRHGLWSNNPTSYTDEWGLCDSAGDITSCHTVAFGETYALSGADVGHTIRVREAASNAGGEGERIISAPTAPVVSAPTHGGLLAPPAGVPSPAGQVLGETAVGPSLAQIKHLLAGVLSPAGKNSRIGALLGRGGYRCSFAAISAGGLAVSWYQVPKGAHLAAEKPVLVGSGRVSFTRAGTANITIRLTGRGKALLRHAKRLRLTARGVLTPGGEPSVSATKSFTLTR